MERIEKPYISVVVPLFNEEGAILELHGNLVDVLRKTGKSFEIIFVDDGSTDKTFEKAKNLRPLQLLQLNRNYGQSTALSEGIRTARGEIVVTMDGDLENHPEDIPILVDKLNTGYDIVSGWRKDRWHRQLFTRRIPSVVANKLISVVSGAKLHDHGCTLKAYRSNVIKKITLKGEGHRLIAAYASILGARIIEVPVNYSPRRFGKSKYGFLRTFKVLLDVFALVFFYKYKDRPMHFFGGIGFFSFLLSFFAFLWMLYRKYFVGSSFIETPLPVLVALFAIVGFQFILMGLLAEILTRQNYSKKRRSFIVKEKISNK